jgi:methylenetetrahydrofolate dehydrogenase (NADP+)/methenyltetrahydrofolate cyclohydrolase
MDGAGLARRIVEHSTARAAQITREVGTAPCLATVLVGDDPASVTYVRMKRTRCEKAGIVSRHVGLPATTTTAELVGAITALSQDPQVHGILLQHPVPSHIDERAAFEAIAPEKDVDGVTMQSFAAMSFGLPGFVSCTPGGIMRMLDEYDVDLAGKHAVVVGRSAILGKPVGMLLLAGNATVTYCHSHTKDLGSIVRQADILVAAVGRARLIRGDMVKPGAAVIDVGVNRLPDGKLAGDVDFASVSQVASRITPVPGGVGPMTIAMLLANTVRSAERSAGHASQGETRIA